MQQMREPIQLASALHMHLPNFAGRCHSSNNLREAAVQLAQSVMTAALRLSSGLARQG